MATWVCNISQDTPPCGLQKAAAWGREKKSPGTLVLPGYVNVLIPAHQGSDESVEPDVLWYISTSNDELWSCCDVSDNGQVGGDLNKNVRNFLPAAMKRMSVRKIGRGSQVNLLGKAPVWAYAIVLVLVCQSGAVQVEWSYRSLTFRF